MKRLIFCLALFTACLATVFAQTGPSESDNPEQTPSGPAQSPDDVYGDYVYEPIRKGDQFIRVALGFEFPLFNVGPEGIISDTKLSTGGMGVLGYSRFINSRVSLGGELGFAFNSTLGDNMFLILPITFKTTYEFVYKDFRFPCSLSLGGVLHSYRSRNFFGPIVKPEIGAYYQYSPEWSFGLATAWNVLPQWYDESSNNRVGNNLDLAIGLRYHF